ncbi:MAG: hypothetical protein DMF61_26345 [Blastocatellia bacterium AA13]|nr:MAG: hypothetical protein DMF61_26345 [Blastocatellia bacterium AA13]
MNDSVKMDMKNNIDIALKEYDSLRKEIDDRLNAPKLYFVPLLFVFFGGVLGWKAEAPRDLILLFVIPILVTFLSFVINAGYYIHRAGKRIARIEDKVFKLSGLPLLTHETETILDRQKLPLWLSIAGQIAVMVFYIAIEVLLFFALGIKASGQLANNSGRLIVLVVLLALPLLLFSVSGIRLITTHRDILAFESKLLSELKSKGLDKLLETFLSSQKLIDGKASATKTKKT